VPTKLPTGPALVVTEDIVVRNDDMPSQEILEAESIFGNIMITEDYDYHGTFDVFPNLVRLQGKIFLVRNAKNSYSNGLGGITEIIFPELQFLDGSIWIEGHRNLVLVSFPKVAPPSPSPPSFPSFPSFLQ
jgi:hypothetical protein